MEKYIHQIFLTIQNILDKYLEKFFLNVLPNLKFYVKLKTQLQTKNTDLWVHFLQTIAITTFETEISNFFALRFSNTSYAKEPKLIFKDQFFFAKYKKRPIGVKAKLLTAEKSTARGARRKEISKVPKLLFQTCESKE